ncbi:Hsp70 family protein [Dactylosporangium aurantiacum]|uniref:Hsp70 family protein n=1 Tax=Dactylosporangium aurantiacum TaxID=35754 RepID=A0A9Q9MC51_9ACTN|nr:Hsp70 family protein [Dactylosporangium aurantiacum]MDG6106416.1 Hsp70 family protein [Dactylosporangium aurantiacum]UWZ50544.1 Hsp70 family protein [Dactylosporangium aurantiacum]
MTGSAVLGVDFGTSNTVAALRTPAGEARLVLFDGSPLLPSAVFADAGGRLIVGRDAQQRAAARPAAYEPNPKRHVVDGSLLLGEVEVPVVDAVTAVLRRVAVEAGGTADRTVLTYPVAWGASRRAVLVDAAAAAGLPDVTLVPEPVAGAAYFLASTPAGLVEGQTALVYDFGAGTFDASVVRRTDGQLQVLASHGLADAGGLDIDAALVAAIHAQLRPADPAWTRLHHPRTPADLRARLQLWDNVRAAKESLSRNGATFVHVPLLDTEVPLGREQLEALAMPILDRTVGAARAALREAGVTADALYRVGGSSRVPLVATLLHRQFGLPAAPVDQPELAVALGSLTAPHPPPQPPGPIAAPATVPADAAVHPVPADPLPEPSVAQEWPAAPAWAMVPHEPEPAPPGPTTGSGPAAAGPAAGPVVAGPGTAGAAAGPAAVGAAGAPGTVGAAAGPAAAGAAGAPGTVGAAAGLVARLRGLARPVPVAAAGGLLVVAALVVTLVANGAADAGDRAADGRSPSPAVTSRSASPSPGPSPTRASPTPAVPTGDLALALVKTGAPCHVGTWDDTAPGDVVIWVAVRGVVTGVIKSGSSGFGLRFAAAGIEGDVRYFDDDGDLNGITTSFDDNPGVSYGSLQLPAAKAPQVLGRKTIVTIVADPLKFVAETDETNNILQVQVDMPAKVTDHGYAEEAGCRVSA